MLSTLPRDLNDYQDLRGQWSGWTTDKKLEADRYLSTADLYYLLRFVLSTSDWPHPVIPDKKLFDDEWLLERCREVQFAPDKAVFIWARGHGKSTVGTFGETIREILNNPNLCAAIFSITGHLARKRVDQIKTELETNPYLLILHPDKLYETPHKNAPVWSKHDGITIKRSGNFANATVEGHGLVDGNYTGSRWGLQAYDDVVTQQTVNTPDQIENAVVGFSLSQACSMPVSKSRVYGTFYSPADPHVEIMRRPGWKSYVHPIFECDWDKAEWDQDFVVPRNISKIQDWAKPVFFDMAMAEDWRIDKLDADQFAVQMLLDPLGAVSSSFDADWLKYYESSPYDEARGKLIYVVVDPANAKKRHSDYTAMWVVAAGADENFYVLDGARGRFNLSERTKHLFSLVRTWGHKRRITVLYERYGLQADTEHLRYVQEQEGYRFPIVEVGGSLAKDDRIGRLIPLFKAGRIWFPKSGIMYTDDAGKRADLISVFKAEEYSTWPQSASKDMLDALSRIVDPDHVYFPQVTVSEIDGYMARLRKVMQQEQQTSWMSL